MKEANTVSLFGFSCHSRTPEVIHPRATLLLAGRKEGHARNFPFPNRPTIKRFLSLLPHRIPPRGLIVSPLTRPRARNNHGQGRTPHIPQREGRDWHRDEGKGRRQRKSLLRWGELANCHSGLSKMSPKCETTKADVMRSIGYWPWSEVNAVSQYVSQISFSSDNVLRNAMSGNQIR